MPSLEIPDFTSIILLVLIILLNSALTAAIIVKAPRKNLTPANAVSDSLAPLQALGRSCASRCLVVKEQGGHVI